jgi:hypothetical protein
LIQDELPANTRHVFIAFVVVVVLTLIFYLCDVQVIGAIEEELAKQSGHESGWSRTLTIMRSVIENLIAGAWAALLLALSFRWIIALIDPRDRVIEIQAGSIGARLRDNARKTQRYTFLGNTATFVSATILPTIVDAAQLSGYPCKVDLYIIDPVDSISVACYASFKTQVSQARSAVANQTISRWVHPIFPTQTETSEKVLSKLLASIYLAAYASIQAGIELRVHLRRSFTPFRADMVDTEVVLTQESASEPGVAFSHRGVFYGWYHKEAAAQLTQATTMDFSGHRVDLINLNLAHPSDAIGAIKASIEAVLRYFPHLAGLAIIPNIVNLAAKRVANPQHSY